MSKQIKITGWNEGLRKVSMTKTIQKYCGVGLREAKEYTDMVLDQKVVVLQANNPQDIQRFVQELEDIGAIVSIVDLEV